MAEGMKEYVEGGWQSANKLMADRKPEEKAELNRALQEQYEIDAAYLRCFSSPDGKVVMEDLTKRYIFKNSYDPGKVNPDQHGHFLEGHRNLVLTLLHRMKRARLGSPIRPEIDLS